MTAALIGATAVCAAMATYPTRRRPIWAALAVAAFMAFLGR